MKHKKTDVGESTRDLHRYGKDILRSRKFRSSRDYTQHGKTSVRKHSIAVALTALALSRKLPIRFNERDLVRGALLHDYFLYDWHTDCKPCSPLRFYRMHGFSHPKTAQENARRDFDLNPRQEEIIARHMWPLTVVPPTSREAWLVSAADKYCSLRETVHRRSKHTRRGVVTSEDPSQQP